MANTDRPTGLRPVSTLSGANWNGAYRKFYTDTNAFMGDIMIQDTASVTGGSDGAFQGVTRATDGTAGNIIGVVVGWEVDPDSLGALFHTGSSTLAVYVAVDPFLIFECQDDGGANIPTADEVGLNYDFSVTAGTTATGVSNMELLAGTAGATALATPLKLVGIVDRPDNELGVANSKCLVTINMHTFLANTGAAGV